MNTCALTWFPQQRRQSMLTFACAIVQAMSLAAGDAAYGPPPPPLPPSAVPPAFAPTAMAEEAAEAPQPVAEAPVEAAAPPPGSYSYQPSGQVFGGVNTRGTITTGCSGGNCGEAGPTTAMGGNDYGVADYDKVKLERRQAMDFCDAHFHAWVNIQKCISELFLNARY